MAFLFVKLTMTPEREEKLRKVLNHRQPDVTVVMENVNDPHNIMAVARSCDSIGVQTMHIIHDETKSGFNRERKGSKSSASANKWVDFIDYDSTEECFRQLQNQGFLIFCTHLGAKSKEIYELDFTKKVALVFGNEKHGISSEALQLSDGNFIIPQVGMIQSLNISVACAVSLYEVFRQRKEEKFYQQRQLSEQEYQLIFERWSKSK